MVYIIALRALIIIFMMLVPSDNVIMCCHQQRNPILASCTLRRKHVMHSFWRENCTGICMDVQLSECCAFTKSMRCRNRGTTSMVLLLCPSCFKREKLHQQPLDLNRKVMRIVSYEYTTIFRQVFS